MQTQYENQDGLLVLPGTNQCAGYIFNFEGRRAYQPIGSGRWMDYIAGKWGKNGGAIKRKG